MTTIAIHRRKALWQDCARNYRVLIDGNEVAKISNGADISIPVSPGKHVIQLKIDWGRSKKIEVNIELGNVQRLECGPNANPFLVLVYITVLRGNYIWLRNADTDF